MQMVNFFPSERDLLYIITKSQNQNAILGS